MDGIAGLLGLALSLARIPLCFCPLSHRWCRRFVRAASVGVATVSGFDFSSRQRPLLLHSNHQRKLVCTHCRFPEGSGHHRCVSKCLSDYFAIKKQFEDEETRPTDIKTVFGTRSSRYVRTRRHLGHLVNDTLCHQSKPLELPCSQPREPVS